MPVFTASPPTPTHSLPSPAAAHLPPHREVPALAQRLSLCVFSVHREKVWNTDVAPSRWSTAPEQPLFPGWRWWWWWGGPVRGFSAGNRADEMTVVVIRTVTTGVRVQGSSCWSWWDRPVPPHWCPPHPQKHLQALIWLSGWCRGGVNHLCRVFWVCLFHQSEGKEKQNFLVVIAGSQILAPVQRLRRSFFFSCWNIKENKLG